MPVVRSQYQTGETTEALLSASLGGTLSFPLELLGVDVTPDSGTFELTDGTATIASGVVATGPPPTYAVSPGDLSAYDPGLVCDAYWAFVVSGETRRYRQRVLLVRWVPACPVSHTSITKGRPVLERMLQGTGEDTFDAWIERGWEAMEREFKRQGNRVHLVVAPSDLYDLAESHAIVELLEDLSLNADPLGTVARALTDWRGKLKALYDRDVLTYDKDDGEDVVEDTRPTRGSLYLTSYSGWTGAL